MTGVLVTLAGAVMFLVGVAVGQADGWRRTKAAAVYLFPVDHADDDERRVS